MESNLNLKNKIRVYDKKTKKFLWEKENLVVTSGRIFALESISSFLTQDNINAGSGRKLLYFSIGNGGILSGQHNAPIPPVSSDNMESMRNTRVAFTNNNENGRYCKCDSVDKKFYGKFFDTLTNGDRWADLNKFTNNISIIYSASIDETDARGEAINEIGFYYGRINEAGQVVDDGLFSRITFASEFLLGTKSLQILYYIYA